MTTTTAKKTLNVATMPLSGRHLIEASAGTGKTFNITRLYLRLLLERALDVKQILVMTFTKAATEEIRGRIAQTLREAVSYWEAAMTDPIAAERGDPVFQALFERYQEPAHLNRLRASLLELDDASVFTIHGFCNKVLSQLAFNSGSAMTLTLETDTQSIWLDATRDWIRRISSQPEHYCRLMTRGWHEPSVFFDTFRQALTSGLTPNVLSEADIEADSLCELDTLRKQMAPAFDEALAYLERHREEIGESLVYHHKARAERERELAVLTDWLTAKEPQEAPPEYGKFIGGGRYPADKKERLKAIFKPLRDLKDTIKKASSDLQKRRENNLKDAPLYALVAQGFEEIRERVLNKKQQQEIVDFDDLISLLAQKIQSGNETLREQLRSLYPAALIDEFQDTDANQYRILDGVYPPGCQQQVLMMIGDPKQAIYGFRGGDIFTYLAAGQQADHQWVMNTNWRSTSDMVDAYNRLFYGNALDAEPGDVFGFDIQYEKVNSTAKAKAANIPFVDPAPRGALNYMVLEGQGSEAPNSQQMQQEIAAWLSAEVQRLLCQTTLNEKALAPADIAVLVRSSREAVVVQEALKKSGLGAVFLSNRASLFASSEAQELYRVLDGIWHSESLPRLSAALSSQLLGYRHRQLVEMLHHEDDSLWDDCMTMVNDLRQIWMQQGCMAMILALLQQRFVATDEKTERHLTNFLHLAEVLERQSSVMSQAEHVLIWLHKQISNPNEAEEQVQRLESDSHLIQIVTQHGSKGLEYPIVFVPFASQYQDPTKRNQQALDQYRFFNPQTKQLELQLGRSDSAVKRVKAEGEAEATRLLYVAVTRAAYRCYLGVAGFKHCHQSALLRALGVSSEHRWEEELKAVIERCDGHTCWQSVQVLPVTNNTAQALSQDTKPVLSLAPFDSDINDNWRLYSFSALTRQQQGVKHRQREVDWEQVDENTVADTSLPLRFTLEKGANAGNLLHDMLEVTDFSAPDWELTRDMAARLELYDENFDDLIQWMREVLAAPLAESLCLQNLASTSTLREAEFYFPLEHADWRQLRAILTIHRQQISPDNYEPVPYKADYELEGMMHGFIDLIFQHNGQYFVADYKSTHLGNRYSDYHWQALYENNQQHLYDLQYLIYCVALHRYLQQNLAGYDPATHFGGVYYLYLRGMHQDNRRGEGIFFAEIDMPTLINLDNAMRGAGEPD